MKNFILFPLLGLSLLFLSSAQGDEKNYTSLGAGEISCRVVIKARR